MLRFTLTINDPETLTAAPAIRADRLAALLCETAARLQRLTPEDDREAPISLRYDTPDVGIWRLAHEDDDAPAPRALLAALRDRLRAGWRQHPKATDAERACVDAIAMIDAAIAAGQAPPVAAPAPGTVFVLFHETNSGHGEVSDGYVEGVYFDEATAERARLARLRGARDAGALVATDPDNPDHDCEEWEHDWIVVEHQIETTAPTHACAECGDAGTPEGAEGGDVSRHQCGYCLRVGTLRPVDTSAPAVRS